ncbi:peptidoglycan-binding protein [Streptomyces sp. NPDC091212]|uniref:peptidoglycan-binding protein n=1 Tax=Streptomyces sp. NPDC091212 TaxID=3155191 RepID=UPI00343E0D8F
MTVPVFEEYEPALDCPCAGCAERRRDLARGLPVRAGGHPAAHGVRRALVLATAAGVALGATGVGADSARAAAAPASPQTGPSRLDTAAQGAAALPAAPDPDTPQGGSAPLHGRPLPGPGSSHPSAELRKSTRADIINRAKRWVNAKVPYSMEKFWSDGYRQDCSGYVSMAWNLEGNEWTGSLAQFGVRIEREELQPGDILLFHNPADPNKGSHVTIFGGWTDYTHSSYVAYEQTKPHTRSQATPMAYWSNSSRYVPYRYKGLAESSDGKGPGPDTGTGAGSGKPTGTGASATFPGASSFGPGANNKYVTQLGQMLVERGGKRFYTQGPGPRWSEADRRATQAFQRAQGWRGPDADGLPGRDTWRYLVNGLGKNIPAAGAGGSPGVSASAGAQGASAQGGSGAQVSAGAPAYPGGAYFRPGRSSTHVAELGKQLVRKGFGKHYSTGPGPRWTEADRRNVEAFQRAQGWRGAEADGYPGPQTWRRLFA